MKYLLFALFLTACGNGATRSDITGAYVAAEAGEFSKSWDTLLITGYDAKANTYVVQQRNGQQKIRNGILQPKEYVQSEFIVAYDPATHQLQDIKTGLIYSFPATDKMIVGTSEYEKIN